MKDSKKSLPELVTKAPSIDSRGGLVLQKSAMNEPSNRDSNQLRGQQKKPDTNPTYQEYLQGVLKNKMKDSWLNTTYQRAIWNARRRLMRCEASTEFDRDEKDVSTNLYKFW